MFRIFITWFTPVPTPTDVELASTVDFFSFGRQALVRRYYQKSTTYQRIEDIDYD